MSAKKLSIIEKGKKNRRIVEEFLKKNPRAPYTVFEEKRGGNIMSDATYYTHRRAVEGPSYSVGSKDKSSSILPRAFILRNKGKPKKIALLERVAKWVLVNPNETFSKSPFQTEINSSSFNYLKRALLKTSKNGNGAAPKRKKSSGLYMSFFRHSSQVPEAAKELLRDFVQTINDSKMARFEVVEYADPKELEVREVK